MKTCELCGSPVTVEGRTTKYYVSENARLKALNAELLEALKFALNYFSPYEPLGPPMNIDILKEAITKAQNEGKEETNQ